MDAVGSGGGNASSRLESEDNFSITFTPPVYRQRYEAVLELSRQLLPIKVVDFGCGECKLLKFLKFHKHIENLIGVDIDGDLLRSSQQLVQPLIADYLIRRQRPLVVQLLKGSIDEPDSRILNCDLMSCVEVIEHLHQPVLDKVPPVIFQILKPKVVIITTPNSDFNVLFPELNGFRHFDHKFEWSKQEFQYWCFKICATYNYKVEFSGVGDPPLTHSHLGYCSQIAVFTRQQLNTDHNRAVVSATPYELIHECHFPFESNPLSYQERVAYESQYVLRLIYRRRQENEQLLDNGSITNGYYNESTASLNSSPRTNRTLIPLSELFEFSRIQELTSSIDDIRRSLQEYTDIELTDDLTSAVFYEEESEDDGNHSDSNHSDGNHSDRDVVDDVGYTVEDWDN